MNTRSEDNKQKLAKKSGRSTSPRAVELRRLQNRLAQRNHRRRVRESTAQELEPVSQDVEKAPAASDGQPNPQAPHTTSPSEQTTQGTSLECSPIQMPNFNIADPLNGELHQFSRTSSSTASMGELNTAQDPSATDEFTFQHEPPNVFSDSAIGAIIPEPYTKVVPLSCGCNGITGPCPGHVDAMWAQVSASAVSSPQSQIFSRPTSRPGFTRSSSQSGTLSTNTSFANRESGAALYSTLANPTNEVSTNTYDAAMAASEYWPNAKNILAVTNTTRRFEAVLEMVRAAGFHDMEGMIGAYYTAHFEPDSIPAMAQSTSRSRRLKVLLKELAKSSNSWPRWQSRGFHETVADITTSLCIDEMHHMDELRPSMPTHDDLGRMITALERLVQDLDARHSYEFKQLGIMEAVPDTMPHLWSLLTETVGTSGVYCERIVRAVLLIVLYTHTRNSQ